MPTKLCPVVTPEQGTRETVSVRTVQTVHNGKTKPNTKGGGGAKEGKEVTVSGYIKRGTSSWCKCGCVRKLNLPTGERSMSIGHQTQNRMLVTSMSAIFTARTYFVLGNEVVKRQRNELGGTSGRYEDSSRCINLALYFSADICIDIDRDV